MVQVDVGADRQTLKSTRVSMQRRRALLLAVTAAGAVGAAAVGLAAGGQTAAALAVAILGIVTVAGLTASTLGPEAAAHPPRELVARLDAIAARLDSLGELVADVGQDRPGAEGSRERTPTPAPSGTLDSNSIGVITQELQRIEKVLRRSHAATAREVQLLPRAIAADVEALAHLRTHVVPRAMTPPAGGWAMDPRNLAHLADLVTTSAPAQVVELGSGLSTVWLAYLLERSGGRLISIDHDEHYATQTRAELTRHGLAEVVDLRLAALTTGATGTWYDESALEDLDRIDLLLVDGPPQSIGPAARAPALPFFATRLSSEALVILDDAQRADERAAIDGWKERFPDLIEVEHGVSTLAVLTRHAAKS